MEINDYIYDIKPRKIIEIQNGWLVLEDRSVILASAFDNEEAKDFQKQLKKIYDEFYP